ncbi:MAG: hypothetical protein R3Y68_08045 [Rikenellaceae bacterium]
MKTLISKIAVATLFAAAVVTPSMAQTPAEKYYGFETGVISTDPEKKASGNWWIQSNDRFSISENQNHTQDGARSMMYSNKKKNKGSAIFCATYEKPGAPIILDAGEYKAECWVYLEEGDMVDFSIQLPAAKFLDGKRIPEHKAKDVDGDFESPFRAASFKVDKVQQGKWVKLQTKWYFAYDGETTVDKLNSFVIVNYPDLAPKAKFYIDDIKIFKAE